MSQEKGLSGLANLGNTCFINSSLQILSHTSELELTLKDNNTIKNMKNISDSSLLYEWINLQKILWTENNTINPNKFINSLQQISKKKNNPLFAGYDQNDLSEFLIFLIDCFHNSLSREINMTITGKIENDTDKTALKCYEMIKNMYKKDYSEIWNLFYAIQLTELKNKDGKIVSMIPEPFFILSLPIPQNKSPSLIDCFDLYTSYEILENENAWYNEVTKEKEDVYKSSKFWSFPKILIIDIKRYNNKNIKNQKYIDFPLDNLDLSSYVSGYKKENYIYDLYGVCNHSGGVLGGHYTSYVKTKNNKWYHFNDTVVSEIKNSDSIITPKAYCLFYRKK
jgi:ubiquitin C-terminal hydrolase